MFSAGFLYMIRLMSISTPLLKKQNDATVQQLRSILQKENRLFSLFSQLSAETASEARLELKETNLHEIAGIIIQDKRKPPEPRAVVCWKTGETQGTFISSISPLYMPLQYPLICPRGEPGWSVKYKEQTGLTQLAYYRQIILRHNHLHLFGSLLNEFAINFFTAVEEQRLEYIRNNQLRGCQQDLINDETIEGEGDMDSSKVYLPASFLGSRRNQRTKIADAQAIAARYGNPTYFITMTTNPNWAEIVSELTGEQTAADRPDVVARVFHARKQQMTATLLEAFDGNQKVDSIQVIEFQKRGLPHAHIAVKFSSEPRTAEEIDRFISAELPEDDDELRAIVEKHMIHSHRSQC